MIRIQILVLLFVTRAYDSVLHTLEKIKWKLSSPKLLCYLEDLDFHRRTTVENAETQPIGISRMLPFFKWYERISTTYMVYVIVRSLIFFFGLSNKFGLTRPPHCYLLGNFITIRAFNGIVGPLYAVFHVGYRILEGNRNYHPNIVMFTLQSDKTITDFYKGKITNEYLRYIMCYPVVYKSRLMFKNRSNRLPRSRKILLNHIAENNFTCIVTFTLLTIIIVPLVVQDILTYEGYLYRYPNCALDVLDKQSITSWSMNWSRHRLIALVFDLVENTLLWVDSGLAVLSVASFTYLLHYDIILYWYLLYEKLLRLENELKLNHLIIYQSFSPNCHCPYSKFEKQINEIQWEYADFFYQIRAVSSFNASVIFWAIFVWFCYLAVIYYMDFLQSGDVLLIIGLLLSYAPAMLSIYMTALFSLTMLMRKSYAVICSIMAYDRSKYKRNFIKILELHKPPVINYIPFHQYPTPPITYLTVAGWSISIFLILSSLFNNPINNT